MSRKKLTRLSIIDPAVEGLIKEMQQHQIESQLPQRDREKKIREREKIASRKIRRVTYDLPPEIRSEVMSLSEKLSIPASQLVTLALVRFLQDYADEKVDLSSYKTPSRSPRYDWNLTITKLPNTEKEHPKKKKTSSGNKVVN